MVKKNSKKPPPKKKTPGAPVESRSSLRRAILTFIISACMFTLGVFVGRGTAPVRFDILELQNELAALREQLMRKEREQAKIYRQAINKEEQLGFYEALKKTADPDEETGSLSPEAPAKNVSKKPTAVNKTTPPASKTPASDRGQFAVQVASVKNGKAADAIVAKLKQKGYSARRVLGKVEGKGLWFRVRVGPYATKQEAADALNRLKNEKFDGIVIRQ